MKPVFTIITTFICFFASAQERQIVGKWKTVDDNTGKVRSVVEIYMKAGKYFGRINQLVQDPGEDPDPVCDDCDPEDPRFNQKVIGMEIIRDMEYDDEDNIYTDGDILDPENGSVYDCRLWIEDNNLKVRGYILFFYRTQTWPPYED